MRVLHLVHDYHPAIGGSEVVFREVGAGLARRGHEMWVFTSTARRVTDFVTGAPHPLPAGLTELDGVRVRRFPYRRVPRLLRRAWDVSGAAWWSGRWPGYGSVKAAWVGPHLPGLVRAACRLRPDLVAATAAPFLPFFAASRIGRRLGVPVVLMPCLHPGDAWLMDNPALLARLRGAAAVLTLTDYERRFLESLGVDRERLHVLGGGVHAGPVPEVARDLRARFGIPAAEPLVLFLGRQEPGKGIAEVVDAMARLWHAGHRATLVLAGAPAASAGGPLEAALARLPSARRERVVVRGEVSEAEKWGWLEACTLLAHPSRVESFGLVYLEAWRCGKPVIGGRTGPQAALIRDGRDGLLVQPGRVDELVEAIRRLIVEPGLAGRMGAAGAARVRDELSWEQVVDRAAAVYEAIAARGTGGAPA